MSKPGIVYVDIWPDTVRTVERRGSEVWVSFKGGHGGAWVRTEDVKFLEGDDETQATPFQKEVDSGSNPTSGSTTPPTSSADGEENPTRQVEKGGKETG